MKQLLPHGRISAMATASPSPLLPYLHQSPAGGKSSGSIGPFLAVISVLTLLSVLSSLLGRICSRGAEDQTPLQSGNYLSFFTRKLQKPCVKDVEFGDHKLNKNGDLQNSSS